MRRVLWKHAPAGITASGTSSARRRARGAVPCLSPRWNVPERNEASAQPAERVAQWSRGIFQRRSQAPLGQPSPARRTLAGLGWPSKTLCRLWRLASLTALRKTGRPWAQFRKQAADTMP